MTCHSSLKRVAAPRWELNSTRSRKAAVVFMCHDLRLRDIRDSLMGRPARVFDLIGGGLLSHRRVGSAFRGAALCACEDFPATDRRAGIGPHKLSPCP